MNIEEARRWLDKEWTSAIEDGVAEPDPAIDALANSSVVSIRYALVTQILGKIADPSRSLFALQLAQGGEGAWDARSFSTAVVVPWVSENQQVLGTSAEPYASKPLRRPRLERSMPNVRSKDEWHSLHKLLEELDNSPIEQTRAMFRRVLRSLVRRLATQDIRYPVPRRIGMNQLQGALDEFLAVAGGGLRPLAVVVSLLTVAGRAFSLYEGIQSQGIKPVGRRFRQSGRHRMP